MIQGTEINARKAAFQNGAAQLANYVFLHILFTEGSTSLTWNLGYPLMSWARIVGAQISKILDYRRSDLNFAPLELAVPGDVRSDQGFCASTQGPTEGCLVRPLGGSSFRSHLLRFKLRGGKRCKRGTQQGLSLVPSSVPLSETDSSGSLPH